MIHDTSSHHFDRFLTPRCTMVRNLCRIEHSDEVRDLKRVQANRLGMCREYYIVLDRVREMIAQALGSPHPCIDSIIHSMGVHRTGAHKPST